MALGALGNTVLVFPSEHERHQMGVHQTSNLLLKTKMYKRQVKWDYKVIYTQIIFITLVYSDSELLYWRNVARYSIQTIKIKTYKGKMIKLRLWWPRKIQENQSKFIPFASMASMQWVTILGIVVCSLAQSFAIWQPNVMSSRII